MTQLYQPSFYNMRVRHVEGILLFNGATGALFKLKPDLYEKIKPFLGQERTRKAGVGYTQWTPDQFLDSSFPEALQQYWDAFLDGGVFIPVAINERDKLKQEYEVGRSGSPLMITMTTTLDCNMRCYYCYQKEGELDYMSLETCNEAIAWTKEHALKHNHKRIFMDWYGGEPMMNKDVILHYSREIIPWCEEHGIKYKAHMLCNGTHWPEDVKSFLDETRLNKIQFSMDGHKKYQNKTRGLVDEQGKRTGEPSFDILMNTIDRVLPHASCYLRINVDPFSGSGCMEMIEEFARRGWFEHEGRFFPYLAIINAMTEHCGFIGTNKKFRDFTEDFDTIRHDFYTALSKYQGPQVLEHIEYYPRRKLINCGAVNPHSIIFGPEGLQYKCSLDVGDHHRANGSTKAAEAVLEAVPESKEFDRWDKFDPFELPTCKECQYLPVCYGGCPRAQMDGDSQTIEDQNKYFEQNFDKMITGYFDRADRV